MGVISLLTFLILFIVVRVILLGDEVSLKSLSVLVGLLAVVIANEYWMLKKITYALQQGSLVHIRSVILNIIIESNLPTIGILILSESSFMSPYHALNAPAILIYPMLVFLSTLKLRPRLSVLAGALASVGYSTAVIVTFLRHDQAQYTNSILPTYLYVTYALFLFSFGFLSAFVSSRIRQYTVSGLHEGIRRQRAEGDLEMARTIQQGLLPQSPPNLEHYDIAGWNEPADQTGGDYYDWMELPDGKFAITIADVTGHGIGPALVTAACRAYVRSFVLVETDIAKILQRVNKLLYADLPSNRFVTYALSVLDLQDNTIQFLSAGHGPLLYYIAETGIVESFNADTFPLGIIDDIEFGTIRERNMKPGDIYVLITDGFFEWARADGKQYGTKRLCEFIRQNASLSAQELIDGLQKSVHTFVGDSPQDDDLTVVVVKRLD